MSLVQPLTRLATEFAATVAAWPPLWMHLFQNDFNPTDATLVGGFVQSTFAGYVRRLMTGLTAVQVGAHVVYVTWDQVLFPCTGAGAQQVFGYYVTDALNTTLFWSERDPNAPFIIDNGQTYVVLPYYSRIRQP